MQQAQNYFLEVQNTDFQELSEHSLRTALENLLIGIRNEHDFLNHIHILQEGKRIGKSGVPDFRITSSQGSVGYVETKKIGENLHETAQSEQIKKYQELNDNILLTDYCIFLWLKGNTIVQKVDLCQAQDLGNKDAKFDAQKGQDLEKLIQNFLRETPKGINNAHDLAKALAIRTRFLKNNLDEILNQQLKNEELITLVGLYNYFKDIVSENFTTAQFSDAFAQTLSYSLFLAKLNAENQTLTLQNIKKFIPISFGVIREIAGFLDNLENEDYKKIQWVVKEIISVVNNLDLEPIRNSLSFNKNLHQNPETAADPYLYFYEDFLGQYDAKLRKAKGVYYTPPALVNFIVRAIDHILQKDFQIKSGLADKEKVTVLDFATGTGTFILEILKQIFEKIPQESTKRQDIIQNHVLKNIYGFEYLIAPYTVAHLKLSQFLKDNFYTFKDKDRLQIYLTNTLEPLDAQVNMLLPELSKEGIKAQKLKKEPVLVICGNPPYSGHSTNKNKWILDRVNEYKKVGNESLDEKNPKWLQDDYVKFIRFAEWKMQQVENGIIGIITNHSFLDNPTFRLMRKSLRQTFGHIYLIDLHGNAKKKEKTPEGGKDQNVFDIEQGVSISIFVKNPKIKERAIFYTDFYGTRQEKLDLCLQNNLESVDWKVLNPKTPFYLFKPQDTTHLEEYNTFWSVKDIFKVQSVGVVTARDNLTIHKTKEKVWETASKFVKLYKDYARYEFKLGDDARDWSIEMAQKDLKKSSLDEKDNTILDKNKIVPITYRPFDIRYTYYTGKSRGFHCMPRNEVMQHFLHEEKNLALITIRRSRSSQEWNFGFISENIVAGATAITSLDINYVFPLYIYEEIKHELDLSNNPEYRKKRKKLEKEFELFVEMLEEQKTVAENLTDTKQKTVFLEMANKVFQKQTACYEKKLANLQSEYEAQKQNGKSYQKLENFTPAFRKFLEKYNENATPEQLLAYIYAVLHSPSYRQKYADFLKMDFPKVPFVENLEQFEHLSKIGQELIDAHLLKKIPDLELGLPIGNGTNEVSDIRFVPAPALPQQGSEFEYGKLYYNKTHYFDKVSPEIWEFQIGGYRVLEKYLKDRKGEILENEEILHLEKVIKVLAFTLEKMQEIDVSVAL